MPHAQLAVNPISCQLIQSGLVRKVTSIFQGICTQVRNIQLLSLAGVEYKNVVLPVEEIPFEDKTIVTWSYLHNDPLWGESTINWDIPLTKGQWCESISMPMVFFIW